MTEYCNPNATGFLHTCG